MNGSRLRVGTSRFANYECEQGRVGLPVTDESSGASSKTAKDRQMRSASVFVYKLFSN